ncbi:hypothetical protein [Parafilimonas sp.]|uniref:hypothetical protein n=1 Tax=Parafilimonas sp. TaxID=1969739 RepID=UPI0039E70802
MPDANSNTTLKRLRNHYRMVIMNDDTFEEVIKFRLSRLSVYMILSTTFLLMISLAVALLVFTPLRYYLPGASADTDTRRALQTLKMRTDSLEQVLRYNETYFKGIKQALGEEGVPKDTTPIDVPKQNISND